MSKAISRRDFMKVTGCLLYTSAEIQFCHLKNSPYRTNPLSQSLTALPAPPMGELFCIFRAGCPSPEKQKLSRPHS